MARKMKDSGIEWIGEIPEGWEVTKLKYLATFPIEKNTHIDSPYIGLENIESWTGKYVSSDSQYDKSQALTFSRNNILFGKLRPYLAKVFCASNDGCCSSEFCILNFSSSVNIRYFWNLLISPTFIDHVTKSTYGTKMPRANTDFIKNICAPVPPRIEQDRIVLYLDAFSAKIDSLISETCSSIEEYKKLKQAVITQAVAKGVRGERVMKDSGVEWIGEIPAEWSICPLKRLAAIQTGSTPSKTSSESFYSSIAGTPWIKPDNLGFSSSIETTAEFLTEEGCSVARILPSNTVYVGCIGSRIGNCGYSLIPCACNQQINALIFNARMYWKYGWYLTIFQEEQYMLLANGNVIQIINSTTQGNISCIVPSISEQREITAYLDAKCAEIDGLIAKKEQLVKELESYKKSLIYEVVTGKREV